MSHSAWVALLFCQLVVHAALCQLGTNNSFPAVVQYVRIAKVAGGPLVVCVVIAFGREGVSLHNCNDNNLNLLCCPLQTILVLFTN